MHLPRVTIMECALTDMLAFFTLNAVFFVHVQFQVGILSMNIYLRQRSASTQTTACQYRKMHQD